MDKIVFFRKYRCLFLGGHSVNKEWGTRLEVATHNESAKVFVDNDKELEE